MPWLPSRLSGSIGYSTALGAAVQSDDYYARKSETALSGDFLGCRLGCDPQLGFFGLIAGAAAAIIGGITSAASAVAPVIATVGTVASVVSTGVQVADGIIKAVQGPPQAAADPAIKAKRAADREAGKAKLAEVMLRARDGDVRAQAIIAGIEILKNPPVQKGLAAGKVITAFGLKGLAGITATTQKATAAIRQAVQASNVIEASGADWKAVEAAALKVAKASGKWNPKPKPMVFPVAKMKAGAVEGLRGALKKEIVASRTRKPGASGWLVTAEGKIMRGKWAPSLPALAK